MWVSYDQHAAALIVIQHWLALQLGGGGGHAPVRVKQDEPVGTNEVEPSSACLRRQQAHLHQLKNTYSFLFFTYGLHLLLFPEQMRTGR